jgi:16S rRNA (cytosine967-C5)-methyltransferase
VLPTGTLRRPPGGAIEELAGFGEGAWWVQDAAAALPARLFGDLVDQSVIDVCAAPGGKTAQLVAAGARVTAVDRSAARLRRLAENMERLGLPVEQVAADAALWKPKHPADAVLLDAPCTATGTIRRHPDILWSKSPHDLERLCHVQDRLLGAAVEMLRPGGLLVYCTCSLQPEEGPLRIELLLSGGAPVERLPVDPEEIGGVAEFVTAQGDLRTLPSHWPELGGIDGFYAARLRRL